MGEVSLRKWLWQKTCKVQGKKVGNWIGRTNRTSHATGGSWILGALGRSHWRSLSRAEARIRCSFSRNPWLLCREWEWGRLQIWAESILRWEGLVTKIKNESGESRVVPHPVNQSYHITQQSTPSYSWELKTGVQTNTRASSCQYHSQEQKYMWYEAHHFNHLGNNPNVHQQRIDKTACGPSTQWDMIQVWKGLSPDTGCNTEEPWKHAVEWKKPDTEGPTVQDSIYTKRPEQANPETGSRWWVPGAGGGGNAGCLLTGMGLPFEVMKKFWN